MYPFGIHRGRTCGSIPRKGHSRFTREVLPVPGEPDNASDIVSATLGYARAA
jgi:hypothetical protein